jgi:hypothetical protein
MLLAWIATRDARSPGTHSNKGPDRVVKMTSNLFTNFKL